MPQKVIFSSRAYTAILAETNEKITTETGGVFLGIVQNDIYYIIETIDPGPNSIFRSTYFEYDRNYVSHLANKINKLYSDKLNVLGLWHRHPGSLDSFSSTDDGTNIKFANENNGIAIYAIVNIDPKFRITVYSVNSQPLNYKKITFEVNDYAIPKNIRDISPFQDIENIINSRKSYSVSSSIAQSSNQKYGSYDSYSRTHNVVSGNNTSSDPRLRTYISNPTNNNTGIVRNNIPSNRTQTSTSYSTNVAENWQVFSMFANYLKHQLSYSLVGEVFFNDESDFDKIVDQLYDDLIFCKQNGIPVIIKKGNNNAVKLIFGQINSQFNFQFFAIDFNNKPTCIQNSGILKSIGRIFSTSSFEKDINNKKLCFIFDNRLYLYRTNMFQSAWKEHMR